MINDNQQKIILGILVLILFVYILFSGSVPQNVKALHKNWPKRMIPPSLKKKVVVYVSAPLFNLSENLYSIGIKGMNKKNNESLVETVGCNLSNEEMSGLEGLGKALFLPEYGMAGLCAQEGWSSYIPARDGFVLAKFIGAVNASTDPEIVKQRPIILGYLTKAIYGNDVYALGAVCNVTIFNGNGLQIDDGSACEVGMCGLRGHPMTIFKDQKTDQFGPGASNPMPLGCASSIITQRSYSAQSAVKNLKQKIKNVENHKNKWWGGYDYCSTVPPPPLVQFWLEVGEAVYSTRYKNKDIICDKNGIQDTLASSTTFFYDRYYGKQKGDTGLVEIAVKIMEKIKDVEKKWADFIPVWAGCPLPFPKLNDIQMNPTTCSST
jgi:hypothetical protein